MKNRTTRSAVLALCSLLAAAVVGAEPSKDGPADREKWAEKHEAKIKEMHEKLGLTPEQEAALKAHRESHREEGRKLREETRAKRETLRLELEKPSVDESKVRALHDELKALEARKADHRFNGVLAVRKILTPEQFKKFHEHMGEKRDGKGRRKGEGRQGRRGGREGHEEE